MKATVQTSLIDPIVYRLIKFNNPKYDFQLSKRKDIHSLPTLVKNVIEEVLMLYQCKPEEQFFQRFEDPICDCRTRSEIRVQFSVMQKIFSRSDTISCDLLDYQTRLDKHGNGVYELILNLNQHYYPLFSPIPIPVTSMVRLVIDHDGNILYHGDYWYHSVLFDNVRGIVGYFWKLLRRGNSIGLPMIAKFFLDLPKDE